VPLGLPRSPRLEGSPAAPSLIAAIALMRRLLGETAHKCVQAIRSPRYDGRRRSEPAAEIAPAAPSLVAAVADVGQLLAEAGH
jgi:hypothetical protein